MAGEWIETFTSLLSKREIKTPMAFYTKVLWVIVATVVAPLYSNIDVSLKAVFVWVGVGFAVILCIWISFFAWKKPDHLLFGAEAHFEKWKIAYGTERGLASPKELKSAVSNPQGQPAGGQQEQD